MFIIVAAGYLWSIICLSSLLNDYLEMKHLRDIEKLKNQTEQMDKNIELLKECIGAENE